MQDEWPRQLDDGLRRLGMDLAPAQKGLLCAYLALLAKWNRVFNLTAVRDPSQWVERHLLDSLAVLPWVRGPRVIDVGSGAGLPGIPLAVARPDIAFVLLDSNSKKTRFLRQAALELPLPNVEVQQARVELYRPATGFDTVVSRAFASLGDFWTSASHLLAPAGVMLAMKGRCADDEVRRLLAAHGVRVEFQPLAVSAEIERSLYILQPVPA